MVNSVNWRRNDKPQYHVLFGFGFSFRALIIICTVFYCPSPPKTCMNKMTVCSPLYRYCLTKGLRHRGFSKVSVEGLYGERMRECLGRHQ